MEAPVITDGLPMWPTEMVPPNNLYPGMVVEKQSTPERPLGEFEARRGVVTRRYKVGDRVRTPIPGMICAEDAEISFGAGHKGFTRNGDQSWRIVPEEEQTAEERVRSAAVTFTPLSHPYEDRMTPEKIHKKLDDLIIDYAVDLPQRVKDVFTEVLNDLQVLAEPLSDDDHIEWHLFAALLSQAHFDAASEYDWPQSFDLAIEVARAMDGTAKIPAQDEPDPVDSDEDDPDETDPDA